MFYQYSGRHYMTTFETTVNLEHSTYIEEGYEGALHLITNTISVRTGFGWSYTYTTNEWYDSIEKMLDAMPQAVSVHNISFVSSKTASKPPPILSATGWIAMYAMHGHRTMRR